jgi:hypothetical protein
VAKTHVTVHRGYEVNLACCGIVDAFFEPLFLHVRVHMRECGRRSRQAAPTIFCKNRGVLTSAQQLKEAYATPRKYQHQPCELVSRKGKYLRVNCTNYPPHNLAGLTSALRTAPAIFCRVLLVLVVDLLQQLRQE